MSRKSLDSLPSELIELLASEREVSPQPEAMRRRAILRARTALWRERSGSRAHSNFFVWFRRLRVALASGLVTSLGFGAWLAFERSDASSVPVTVDPPPTPIARVALSERVTQVEGALAEEAPSREEPNVGVPQTLEVPPAFVAEPPQPAQHRSRVQPSVPTPATGPSPDELNLLETAREALLKGEHHRALSLLKTHKGRFPKSHLDEEREALRVRALQRVGLDEEARRAAKAFESRHPKSVLVPTLKSSE